MRALVQERIALSSKSPLPDTVSSYSYSSSSKKRSLTMLLFGCRSQQDDYLYEHEWLQCVEDVNGNGKVVINCTPADTEEILPPFDFIEQDGELDMAVSSATASSAAVAAAAAAVVVTAFSRKGRNAGRRVTHSLHTHQAAVWSLIRQVSLASHRTLCHSDSNQSTYPSFYLSMALMDVNSNSVSCRKSLHAIYFKK
jgi:hypothetical protein